MDIDDNFKLQYELFILIGKALKREDFKFGTKGYNDMTFFVGKENFGYRVEISPLTNEQDIKITKRTFTELKDIFDKTYKSKYGLDFISFKKTFELETPNKN